MSEEDIRIRLTAQDAGATAALQKLRNEVLLNDRAIKNMSQQGKMTGKSLKDMASFVGPEIGMLGDRIENVSGALGDVAAAGLLAKGGIAGAVSFASFQVGEMLGNIVFQTEAWKKAHEDAIKSISEGNAFIAKQTQDRFDKQIQLADLAATKTQRNEELSALRAQKSRQLAEAQMELIDREAELRVALGNDIWKYGQQDNQIAEERVKLAKEHLAMMQQQFDQVDKMRYQRQSDLDLQIKRRQAEAEAEKARAAAAQKEMAEQAALNKSQETYLESLNAELVRIRDGEEAYTRLTLAKQGFEQATVDSALAIKAEIDALKAAEAEKVMKDRETLGRQTGEQRSEFRSPGLIQATQQRFITRGTGSRVEEKILSAAQKQVQKQGEVVAALNKLDEHFRRIGVA